MFSDDGYEILATTCHDDHCPTLYRDPVSGRVGVRGYTTTDVGETREHVAWMTPAEWAALSAGGQ